MKQICCQTRLSARLEKTDEKKLKKNIDKAKPVGICSLIRSSPARPHGENSTQQGDRTMTNAEKTNTIITSLRNATHDANDVIAVAASQMLDQTSTTIYICTNAETLGLTEAAYNTSLYTDVTDIVHAAGLQWLSAGSYVDWHGG